MKKHFKVTITDDAFRYERDEASIAQEACLDGMYAIRTNVPKDELTSEEAVASYKQLAVVEKAFRSLKTVDVKVRPIYRARRIKCHIFLCMLAYYVQWRRNEQLAPMLFAQEDPAAAKAGRASVVAPAQPSPEAQSKGADHGRRSRYQLPVVDEPPGAVGQAQADGEKQARENDPASGSDVKCEAEKGLQSARRKLPLVRPPAQPATGRVPKSAKTKRFLAPLPDRIL